MLFLFTATQWGAGFPYSFDFPPHPYTNLLTVTSPRLVATNAIGYYFIFNIASQVKDAYMIAFVVRILCRRKVID